jgi:hypothetical protein
MVMIETKGATAPSEWRTDVLCAQDTELTQALQLYRLGVSVLLRKSNALCSLDPERQPFASAPYLNRVK